MTDSPFNQEVREKVLAKIVSTMAAKLYDPALNGIDWQSAATKHREAIIKAETREEFESCMNALIKELRVSHAGFFSLAAAKVAIGATFHNGGNHWVFQDVHPGGPAHIAGVQRRDARRERVQILVPVSKKENRPLVEIQPASWTR